MFLEISNLEVSCNMVRPALSIENIQFAFITFLKWKKFNIMINGRKVQACVDFK